MGSRIRKRQAQVLVHIGALDGTVSKCRAAIALEGLADNISLRCSPVHSPVLCASPPFRIQQQWAIRSTLKYSTIALRCSSRGLVVVPRPGYSTLRRRCRRCLGDSPLGRTNRSKVRSPLVVQGARRLRSAHSKSDIAVVGVSCFHHRLPLV